MSPVIRDTPTIWRVPELPVPYVPMEQLDSLVEAITQVQPQRAPRGDGQRSDSGVVKLGISGASGAGKTTLATALARSTIVQVAFPDGIYWLDIGRSPQLTDAQTRLARALGAGAVRATSLSTGKQVLARAFAGKRALLILDDVDLLDHAAAFDVLDHAAHMLLTTRDSNLVRKLGAREFCLPALEPDRARAFMYAFARPEVPGPELDTDSHGVPNRDSASGRAHVDELVAGSARIPLALAALGACIGNESASLADAATSLRESTARWNDRPEHPALAAIGAALELWSRSPECAVHAPDAEPGAEPADNRTDGPIGAYIDLAVFPESKPVPAATIALLWARRGLDAEYSERLLRSLCAYRLLERAVLADGRVGFRLHDLCAIFVRARTSDPSRLHNVLVEIYAEACGGRFAGGPDDGYFWQQLPYHLARAGRLEELQSLLIDYDWLLGSLRACGLPATVASFELARKRRADTAHGPSDALALVCGVLAEASDILGENPDELAGQLLGRLGNSALAHSALEHLLVRARRADPDRARLTPVFASLTPPGGPLIGTLPGHASWVNAVAVLANGQRAVSAAEDRTIKVWDLSAQVELFALSGHDSNITAVAVTRDGRRAVSASSDKTLIVWDLEMGASVRKLVGHTRGVNDVAIVADGTRAISVSRDQTLRIWELASGRLMSTIRTHGDYVRTVAVTGDGRMAVTGSRDHTLKVWDLTTEQELCTLTGHTGWINAVAVSADGQRAVSASEDHTVRLWDIQRGVELSCMRGHSRWVNDVALTADGRHAITGSRDQTLRVWDVENGAELCTLTGHRRWVNAVAVTDDGRRAVSGSRDGTIKLWNLQRTTSARARAGHRGWVNALAITPDGQSAISGSTDKTLRVWDIATGAQVRTLSGHDDGINAIAVTPDGRRVVSASRDRTLASWDVATGERLCVMRGHALGAVAVTVTPDGARAISASSDKTVRVWDIHTGALLQTLTGHSNWINAVAVTADGSRVLSASEDRTIAVWTIDPRRDDGLYQPEPTATLRGHAGSVVAIAVTADGRSLLSASGDRTLRIWNLEHGTEMDVLSEQSSWINALTILNDNRHLVTVSSRKRVEVWTLTGKRPLATFTGEGAMLCCAAHPHDDLIAVGDAGGTVHFLRFRRPE